MQYVGGRIMKRLLAAACILALVFAKSGYSGTLTGDLIFYDSSGFQVIPPGVAPITGLVDFDSDTLVINPFLFFGQTTITNVLEILP
jgi:hypothetical protein